MQINTELSQLIAIQVQSQPNQCYQNAARALEVLGSTARYVEGFLLMQGLYIPMRHAWIELDGIIIDPSPLEGVAAGYYPVACYTYEQVVNQLKAQSGLPFFGRTINLAEQEKFLTGLVRSLETSANSRARGNMGKKWFMYEFDGVNYMTKTGIKARYHLSEEDFTALGEPDLMHNFYWGWGSLYTVERLQTFVNERKEVTEP